MLRLKPHEGLCIWRNRWFDAFGLLLALPYLYLHLLWQEQCIWSCWHVDFCCVYYYKRVSLFSPCLLLILRALCLFVSLWCLSLRCVSHVSIFIAVTSVCSETDYLDVITEQNLSSSAALIANGSGSTYCLVCQFVVYTAIAQHCLYCYCFLPQNMPWLLYKEEVHFWLAFLSQETEAVISSIVIAPSLVLLRLSLLPLSIYNIGNHVHAIMQNI